MVPPFFDKHDYNKAANKKQCVQKSAGKRIAVKKEKGNFKS